ncbi:hypothetical protein U8335_01585 [Roseiconus lacunae]|uniref:hypothetical protein n=1 Tax=Roseiconus lacunae TaxID=2605694 RepID=UPI003091CACB|nr:hypothetical protein U8335_01585 [Stieleria sp. HD01]
MVETKHHTFLESDLGSSTAAEILKQEILKQEILKQEILKQEILKQEILKFKAGLTNIQASLTEAASVSVQNIEN